MSNLLTVVVFSLFSFYLGMSILPQKVEKVVVVKEYVDVIVEKNNLAKEDSKNLRYKISHLENSLDKYKIDLERCEERHRGFEDNTKQEIEMQTKKVEDEEYRY